MDYFTVNQAAKMLNLSETTIRVYCQTRKFGKKVGSQWLITEEEIAAYQANRRPPGRPKKRGR